MQVKKIKEMIALASSLVKLLIECPEGIPSEQVAVMFEQQNRCGPHDYEYVISLLHTAKFITREGHGRHVLRATHKAQRLAN